MPNSWPYETASRIPLPDRGEAPEPALDRPASPPRTTRWLLSFGYDGTAFAGWARQPGLRTVEGEILRGLERTGVSPGPSTAGLRVASRTDRGVSARANALTLESDLAGEPLLRALNGIAPEIFFTAASRVASDFRVRSPHTRTYRYFEAPGFRSLSRWRAGARLFEGPVDVRSFGRGFPASAPVSRTVDAVAIRRIGRGLRIEVTARSFVWGMVRKMVAALRELDAERLSVERLTAAIEGRERLTLPMAEPEPLVLWEVKYSVPWDHRAPRPTRAQLRRAELERRALWCRARVLDSISGATPGLKRHGAAADGSGEASH